MSTNTEFTDLEQRFSSVIKFLERRYIYDKEEIASEIRTSLWEHHCAGVVDARKMVKLIDVDVRRYVRREQRVTRTRRRLEEAARPTPMHAASTVGFEAISARMTLDKINIPASVHPWVCSQLGSPVELTDAERMRGHRWAQRTRRVLADA